MRCGPLYGPCRLHEGRRPPGQRERRRTAIKRLTSILCLVLLLGALWLARPAGPEVPGLAAPVGAKNQDLTAIDPLHRRAAVPLHLSITWERGAKLSAAGLTLADLVGESDVFHDRHALNDLQAIDDNLRWMLSRSETTISLSLGPNAIDSASAETLMQNYLDGIRHYIEQGYNAVSCSYRASTGMVTLSFSSGVYSGSNLTAARTGAMNAAIELHDRLWREGTLRATMDQSDIAWVYYTWLAKNCAYDSKAAASSPSHTAYGLFQFGQAVCDGYTAAYNLLLKLEGIPCTTYSVNDHIWTVAELDGRTVHSDATWGDQGSYVAYQYFGMTEAKALSRF